MKIIKDYNLTLETIEDALQNITYELQKQEIIIEAIFELESYEINGQDDQHNFQGIGRWLLDTEYGGGPVNVETSFVVASGELEVDVETIDYDTVLNWEEIEYEMTNGAELYDDEDDVETKDHIDDDDYAQHIVEKVSQEDQDPVNEEVEDE